MAGEGTISIQTRTKADSVCITIDDTGPGIPQETLGAIWEPFYTTKSEELGTGLGLAICKDIVFEHGGTIDAENREDGGARFTVVFPFN